MTTRLGREITRAMTKANLSSVALAERAGVGASWVRQVKSGRIQKPEPDKLARVARELGLQLDALLAMSDQLGAAVAPQPSQDNDLASAIRELTEELRASREERKTMRDDIDGLRNLVGSLAAQLQLEQELTARLARHVQLDSAGSGR